MKQIQPIQTWANGEQKNADHFNLKIVADDLKSFCTFYWELLSIKTQDDSTIAEQLANGNLSLTGEEYEEWDGNNDYAYQWCANKLNIVFI